MHSDEGGDGIDGGAYAGIVEIEGIVEALCEPDIDVHPLDGLAGGVGDRVGVTKADWSSSGSFEEGGAAVDGELRLAVEDDEHLLAVIVEVCTDAAIGRQYSAVEKEEIRARVELGGLRAL